MVENVILGAISNGGHIEIQDGGNCGYYHHVACTKMVQMTKYSRKIKISWQYSFHLCIESGYVE
jgi:hypothetical protein